MTKTDLKTSDIIVNRAGYLGVILKEEQCVLYQTIGIDWLDDFNEDLAFVDADYPDGDIMEVYRGNTFIDLDDNEPFWQRDETWARPTKAEMQQWDRQKEEERLKMIEHMRNTVFEDEQS